MGLFLWFILFLPAVLFFRQLVGQIQYHYGSYGCLWLILVTVVGPILFMLIMDHLGLLIGPHHLKPYLWPIF
jgi:hypothetical protein